MKKWKYYKPVFECEEKFNDLYLPWAGHKYFAYDLIRNLRPRKIVELGTYRGTSLFSFCQAVKDEALNTELFAIDTWEGDEHSGFYGDEIFKGVKEIVNLYYNGQNVNLIRSTFDEALQAFDDNSIDILHIDGLHTYEAASHDFEGWLSKVSDDGVILFHDIVVTRDDFGVYNLWKELEHKYKTMEFRYSYGLGVLFKSGNNSIITIADELELYYSYNLEDVENGKIAAIMQDLNAKTAVIEQKNTEIGLMKSSKFWKLREYCVKLRSLYK